MCAGMRWGISRSRNRALGATLQATAPHCRCPLVTDGGLDLSAQSVIQTGCIWFCRSSKEFLSEAIVLQGRLQP